MSNQDDLHDFVNNPETIKRAAEGSMEKRLAVMSKSKIKAGNYGEVLALINDLELVSFEDDGGYQGEYKAILTDGKRDFYYFGSYGSCAGCDWIEDVTDSNGEIEYKEALDYCAGVKPTYIVPKDITLQFASREYYGFTLASVRNGIGASR